MWMEKMTRGGVRGGGGRGGVRGGGGEGGHEGKVSVQLDYILILFLSLTLFVSEFFGLGNFVRLSFYLVSFLTCFVWIKQCG